MAREMLGPILLSIHNLTYYQRLLADAREAIEADRFAEFRLAEDAGWVGALLSNRSCRISLSRLFPLSLVPQRSKIMGLTIVRPGDACRGNDVVQTGWEHGTVRRRWAEGRRGCAASSIGKPCWFYSPSFWRPVLLRYSAPAAASKPGGGRCSPAVKKNDRVVTTGGIYGVVTNVHREADEVTIKSTKPPTRSCG